MGGTGARQPKSHAAGSEGPRSSPNSLGRDWCSGVIAGSVRRATGIARHDSARRRGVQCCRGRCRVHAQLRSPHPDERIAPSAAMSSSSNGLFEEWSTHLLGARRNTSELSVRRLTQAISVRPVLARARVGATPATGPAPVATAIPARISVARAGAERQLLISRPFPDHACRSSASLCPEASPSHMEARRT